MEIQGKELALKLLQSKYLYPLLLIVLAVLTHWQWFKLGSIFTEGDWEFWFTESAREMGRFWDIWDTSWYYNIGQLRLHAIAFRTIWAGLTQIGASFPVAVQLSFLIPIALGSFLSPYFFSKKIIDNRLIAFVTAVFYGTSTHFLLIQSGHLPLAIVYALIPLVFYLYLEALDSHWPGYWVLFILSYWVALSYDLRGTYILTLMLIGHFIFFQFKEIRKSWKALLGITFLLFLLSGFIWVPYLLGNVMNGISQFTAVRDLFGNNLYDLPHALTISNPLWTGEATNRTFTQQPILKHLWLAPFIALLSLIPLLKRPEWRKSIAFFWLVSLVGIFLTKQSASPFPDVYQWLYLNFPGFSMFREASKFYVITTIGYVGLIGYALLYLKEVLQGDKKAIFYITVSALLVVSLWNTKPLVTGTIGTVFTPRQVPSDYLVLKDFLLSQPEYSRTLWVPTASRWSLHTVNHPLSSGLGLLSDSWKHLVTDDIRFSGRPINEKLVELLRQPYAKQLLDYSSIRYVIVPIEDTANNDNFFPAFGGSRQYFTGELDKIDYLKKIDLGTTELAVYENQDFKPRVSVLNAVAQIESVADSRLFSYIAKDFARELFYAASSMSGRKVEESLPYFTVPSVQNVVSANLITDPSFEQGAWQPRNSGCYAAGDADTVGTIIQSEHKTDGRQAVMLVAEEHAACTHVALPVKENTAYYVQFDYRSESANTGSFCLGYNDAQKTNLSQTLLGTGGNWQTYKTVVTVPQGVTSANFCFIVSPDSGRRAVYQFDNVLFAPADAVGANLTANDAVDTQTLPVIETESYYPTKHAVTINSATTPFFLTVGETYHPGWQARLVSADYKNNFFDLWPKKYTTQLDQSTHYLLGGTQNAWLINPETLCKKETLLCSRNVEGAYDLKMVVEFWPQRYFLVGMTLTLFGLGLSIAYMIYSPRKRK